MNYKRGCLSGFAMMPALLLMLLPACKCESEYKYFPASGTGIYFNGIVGNIYQFTFGTESLGKFKNDSTSFNFALFLGFMGILASIILGIIYMAKSNASWKLKLAETISSGVAMFFMSPLFSVTAVYGFYNALPDSDKTGSYADYKNFKFGAGFVILFIFLIAIFVYNLVSTIKAKKRKIAV